MSVTVDRTGACDVHACMMAATNLQWNLHSVHCIKYQLIYHVA